MLASFSVRRWTLEVRTSEEATRILGATPHMVVAVVDAYRQLRNTSLRVASMSFDLS